MSMGDGPVGSAKQLKVRINTGCDRVIYHCDNYLRDATYLSSPRMRRLAHWLSWRIGNLAWMVRDLPKLTAYELVADGWTLRCIRLAAGCARDVAAVLSRYGGCAAGDRPRAAARGR